MYKVKDISYSHTRQKIYLTHATKDISYSHDHNDHILFMRQKAYLTHATKTTIPYSRHTKRAYFTHATKGISFLLTGQKTYLTHATKKTISYSLHQKRPYLTHGRKRHVLLTMECKHIGKYPRALSLYTHFLYIYIHGILFIHSSLTPTQGLNVTARVPTLARTLVES